MIPASIVPAGSWWTCPKAQKDRAAFNEAAAAQWPRMLLDKEAAAKVDRLITNTWHAGMPMRRFMGNTWTPWSA